MDTPNEGKDVSVDAQKSNLNGQQNTVVDGNLPIAHSDGAPFDGAPSLPAENGQNNEAKSESGVSDMERKSSIESVSDGPRVSRPSEEDALSQTAETEDHVLFTGITYLGASALRSPRNEPEIIKNIVSMNAENRTPAEVDLLVPRVPQGMVVLYEPGTEDEITKYPVFRIIFCVRGGRPPDPLSLCFAFTFGHGSNDEAIFLCHVFRCQNAEQVSKIIMCFASAFRKPVASQLPQGESVFVFDVSMEVREDDGKGSFQVCPRESRDCFKFRVNIPKFLQFSVLQVSPENPHLSLEKCTGIWLAAGKNVTRSDFHFLPVETFGNNGKQFNATCRFDPYLHPLLNTETPGEHRSHITLILDVGVAGFTEALSFVLTARARIFPQTEKFWMPGRRQLQETFFLKLLWKPFEAGSSQKGYYSMISLESQSQKEGKSPTIASLLEGPSSSDENDSEQIEEEPLPSGYGPVSKECTPEELKEWSDVLLKWRPNLHQRPKTLAGLVRKSGIPQSLRCEVWQLLSGCFDCEELLENYKGLSVQESVWDSAISKDITRTFPAHEYFRTKGSEGQDQLYRVIKAYANRDQETGYCQSLTFIAATLLLHMPEEQAFCLLVKIMENYGMRDLMKCDFEGLRLAFYLLERLLEEKLPDVFYHLKDAGVEMHMFASQWFLTLFTAKFPLFCVFRIVDLFLCDGHLVLYQVALSLLRVAKQDLLQLDFEGVLKYFRVNLPKRYTNEDTVCLMLYHAVNEKIPPKKFQQLTKDYQQMKQQLESHETPVERLQRESREHMAAIMRLDQENDELAYEMISGKVQLRNQLDTAEDQIDLHQKDIARLSALLVENDDEIKRLREEGAMVKEVCRKIEQENKQNIGIVAEYRRISAQLEERLQKMETKWTAAQDIVCENCRNIFVEKQDGDVAKKTVQSPEEDRIRELELELAKTKLALVEKECQIQEMVHELARSASDGQQQQNNLQSSWLSKAVSSIKAQAVNVSASSSGTNMSQGSVRGRKQSRERQPIPAFPKNSSLDGAVNN
ncbi:rab GTPase-activating protein 1-like [Paramacrobiotus metropolitanus]|uniref:rab GTPase-activating protein 1-like n=1 Tax=Paramacrobiotus metropolitanus TaxID=2943436 RepID=UPI002446131B|nr:rab GTPase-activating protein 1-like [Paramacrobiotus metropolitanus]XP_055330294.1 rab GTPase-activating protein 1-like [Paramacrobiotus metropolitanus]XP_055330301.1 rab GTPase-activating protein 1-like [Paramacrobiotus metropolitanus]XP_055330311.1 rab GTPase-activating protein 1-like [Paramacrobiotus metropolitanus]XP_055330315.1 rab GTPase-activating protein 1-like [Paramacrobiotus metropolitanus]XP_055330324.1 rab GTPase-activating protein 1-like [Paramacrobiotus metropolitanus]